MTRPTFEQAKARYVHRYTAQHVPAWAHIRNTGNGKFYAPHFATDAEWYANTVFPGEKHLHGNCKHCETTGQTWPFGQWLDAPFTVARVA